MYYLIHPVCLLDYIKNISLRFETTETGEGGQLDSLLVSLFYWVSLGDGIFLFVLRLCFGAFLLVECRTGSHGPNCSLNCSSYCQEKACDRYSGECLHGCSPGYQKPDCVMRKFYLKLSLCCCIEVLCYPQKYLERLIVQDQFMHHNRLLKKLNQFLGICSNEDYGKI